MKVNILLILLITTVYLPLCQNFTVNNINFSKIPFVQEYFCDIDSIVIWFLNSSNNYFEFFDFSQIIKIIYPIKLEKSNYFWFDGTSYTTINKHFEKIGFIVQLG